jgi:hypothetical protein
MPDPAVRAGWSGDAIQRGLRGRRASAEASAERVCEEDGRSEDDTRWLWLACRVAPDLWDDEAWHQLATRQVRFTAMPAH